MVLQNGNGSAVERGWLVWVVRFGSATLLSWIAYTTYQNTVTLEGVRMLVASQGHELERLEMWRDGIKH